MSKKDNFLFWFVMASILFIGFVIGYLTCNSIINPRKNEIKSKSEANAKEELQFTMQLKRDSVIRLNYRKQKIELAMTMYKAGYFFGIMKHSVYGNEAFNIFKKDSANARKIIE